jgi:hypothetical protein
MQNGTETIKLWLAAEWGSNAMSKAIREAVAHPQIITVGELIDELCRLPDSAAVHFRCPMLEQELKFYRLRKRSKDVVEIEINAYPTGGPCFPHP